MKTINAIWILALLIIVLCRPGASAFAQSAKTNAKAGQSSEKPLKPSTNANPQQRHNARTQVAAAAAARAQADRQYKIYLDAIKQHNKDVQQFVKNKKDGVR